MNHSPPGSRSIFRRLLGLAWPVIGLNVLNVLALAVDTAMVGRTPHAETALTGLGFAVQLIFLLMVAMMGLTVGTVALVARAHGASLTDRVRHILLQSSQLAVLLGLGVAVGGNLVAPFALRLLGAEGVALEEGLSYLRPLLSGSVFYYLTILYGASLRAAGNTRVAFLVALGSNLVNFLCNYALILGNWGAPALGVQGAAIGTLCSQIFSVVVLSAVIRRGVVPGIELSFRPAPLDRGLARELFRIGAPAAADMVILNASFLSIVGMLGHLDPIAVAAHGVGLRLQALAFVPGMSVSQATGAMVGNALGAGDASEARRVVKASLALCVVIMTSLAVLITAFDDPLISLFDIDASSPMAGLTRTWMWMLAACMLPSGIHIALVGMFQGAGATRTSLRINLISTLLVQIPLSWLFGFPMGMGVFGVWLGFPISFVAKALLALGHWRRGDWAKTGARA